ncbi:MAG: ABC transporter permease [Acidobacteriota bacterium]
MHNLGTVFGFEVIRTLKKKSFWIMALLFPVLMGVVFGIVFFSNQATEDAVKNMEKQSFSAVVMDESQLVSSDMITALGFQKTTDKTAAINQVKHGQVDAFLYYPPELKNGTEIYSRDVGIFNNGRYSAVANLLLEQSVNSTVSENTRLVVSKSFATKTTFYKDGVTTDPIMQMIAPGLFLVLFYFLIAMFGNQAITSTTDEKENRVIEMLLTTVEARTVIVGKIFALIVLALIQALLLIVPALIGYLVLHDQLALPSLDLSAIPVDAVRVASAAVIFAASFMLFIGLLVAIGAAFPTAKEAGSAIGFVMMALFGPLYAAPLFISSPDQLIVQILSYFPLTAPIPLLLRNAAGTITPLEILVSIAVLVIGAAVVVHIAVRIFQSGALEYSRKLSLKEIFGRS